MVDNKCHSLLHARWLDLASLPITEPIVQALDNWGSFSPPYPALPVSSVPSSLTAAPLALTVRAIAALGGLLLCKRFFVSFVSYIPLISSAALT